MQTSIESPDNDSQVQTDEMMFYIVSPKKFLILFLATFGMYTVYWFFKHWSQYKKSTNDDLWPVMRGLFSIFFTHSLFSLFEMKYEQKTGEAPRSINHLATIYVVFSVGCQVLGKFSDNGYGNPMTFYLSLLVLPVTCWVLYNAQSLANYSGEDVKGATNNELTGLNYIWLIIGFIFWCLALIGLYTTATAL